MTDVFASTQITVRREPPASYGLAASGRLLVEIEGFPLSAYLRFDAAGADRMIRLLNDWRMEMGG